MPLIGTLASEGCFATSLGQLCRWLGKQAEQLGATLLPGFAGSEVLYADNGAVIGVATGDLGLEKDGTPGPQHQRGVENHC